MSDSLRARFDAIDLKYIHLLVEEQEPETLHLEFKRIGGDSSHKKHLAKAIAGFANADGGIVIWGIGTIKSDEIDMASSLEPFADVNIIVGRFNRWTPDAASPVVEGVKHRVVEDEDGRGFICTFVPVSDAGPHMAKLGVNQYIKRCADRFLAMEHHDVADMFGRRPRPLLAFATRLVLGGLEVGLRRHVAIIACVRNDGRGVATNLMMRIQETNGKQAEQTGLDGNFGFILPPMAVAQGNDYLQYGGKADVVAHPGDVVEVAKYEAFVNIHSDGTLTSNDMLFQYEIYCAERAAVKGQERVRADEIVRFVQTNRDVRS